MNPAFTLFRAIHGRLPPDYTFERFLSSVAGWEIRHLNIDGETVGAVMIRGNELHVAFEQRPKASARAHIKQVLVPMLKAHGHIVTSVSADNFAGLRFCERLGFVAIGARDGAVMFRCERLNHV